MADNNVKDAVKAIEGAWTDTTNRAKFDSTLNDTINRATVNMTPEQKTAFMDAALSKLQTDGILGQMEAFKFGNEDSVQSFGYSQGFGGSHKLNGLGAEYYTKDDFIKLASGEDSVRNGTTVDLATQFLAEGAVNNFSGIQGEDSRMFSSSFANGLKAPNTWRDWSDSGATIADFQTWGGKGKIAGLYDDGGHSATADQERWKTQNMLVQVSDNSASSPLLQKINSSGVMLSDLTKVAGDSAQMSSLTADQQEAVKDMITKYAVIKANSDSPNGPLTQADVLNYAKLNGTTLAESEQFVNNYSQYKILAGDSAVAQPQPAVPGERATSPADITDLDTALKLFGAGGRLQNYEQGGKVSLANWNAILANPANYGLAPTEAQQLRDINGKSWGKFDAAGNLSLDTLAQARSGSLPDFNATEGKDAFSAVDAANLQDMLKQENSNPGGQTFLANLQTSGVITKDTVSQMWQQKEANPADFDAVQSGILNELHNSFDNLPGQSQGKVTLESLMANAANPQNPIGALGFQDKDNVLAAFTNGKLAPYLTSGTHTITEANLHKLVADAQVSGNILNVTPDQLTALQKLDTNHTAYTSGSVIDLAAIAKDDGYSDPGAYDAANGNVVMPAALKATVADYVSKNKDFVNNSLLTSGSVDNPATAVLNADKINNLDAAIRNGTSNLTSDEKALVTSLHDSFNSLKGKNTDLTLKAVTDGSAAPSGAIVAPASDGGTVVPLSTTKYRIGSKDAPSFGELASARAALVKSQKNPIDTTPISADDIQNAKVDILELSYISKVNANAIAAPKDLAANLKILENLRSYKDHKMSGINADIFGKNDLYTILGGDLQI